MPSNNLHKHLLRIGALLSGFFPATVMAAGEDLIPVGTVEKMSEMVTLIVGALHVFTWMVFVNLNIVLDPDFIGLTGNASLLTMLNNIWVLSRDLVNVAFAIVLVFAAVAVIITQKKDFITSYWSKFVLAVILVNFSWFFPRVILDVANVAAGTVYSIPSLIGADECSVISSKDTPGIGCTKQGESFKCPCMYVNTAKFFLDEADKNALDGWEGWECPLDQIMCVQKKVLTKDAIASHSAILNGLIVNHARLQSLAQIPPPVGGSSISQLLVFLMREALILLFHVMLFFPLLAMLLAFLVRIPVLWLTIAFMPFAVLQFVLPDSVTMGWPKKIVEYFLKAAFLPAVVGIPLAIGFILVNTGSNIAMPAIENVDIKLLDDIGNFWQIVWLMMSMGVLWAGVFAALQKMQMEHIPFGSEKIKGFGQSLGRIAVKAPLSVPFLPSPGGGGKGMSILGASQKFKGIESGMDSGMSLPEAFSRGDKTSKEDKAAQHYAQTPESLKKLDDEIKKFATVMNDATKTEEQKKAAADNLKTHVEKETGGSMGDIDISNPTAALNKFLEKVESKKTEKTDQKTIDAIGAVKESIKAIKLPDAPAKPVEPPTPPPAGT